MSGYSCRKALPLLFIGLLASATVVCADEEAKPKDTSDPVTAQEEKTESGGTAVDVADSQSLIPATYAGDEFPAWLRSVRRFEIIAFGSFPVMLFYSRFGFDLERYLRNGAAAEYAPWPFKNENSYTPTDDEQIQAVIVAALSAFIIAGIDAILVDIRTR